MNFDIIHQRKNTQSIKWDGHKLFNIPEDALPLWVADMDFRTHQPIIDAIVKKANEGIFGYTFESDAYFNSIIQWMARRHQFTVLKDWIVTTPGVVSALNATIQAFTEEKDAILIQQPVYHPFRRSILNNKRRVVNNSLRFNETTLLYELDLQDFEHQIVHNKVKLFVLCSPANPVGKVWQVEELVSMADICQKHQVIIFSDEIHMDFVFPPHRHQVLVSIKKDYQDFVITATAPSKTFNLAGIKMSQTLIPSPVLRQKFNLIYSRLGITAHNIFGSVATEAAYTRGDDYVDEMVRYLQGNIDWILNFIHQYLPQIHCAQPQSLYLIWLDFRQIEKDPRKLESLLLHQAKLWCNQGSLFGEEGRGFVRFNVACPRSVLEVAFKQLKQAIDQRNIVE
jgi:cysteine-S-conjugate beta-lyase